MRSLHSELRLLSRSVCLRRLRCTAVHFTADNNTPATVLLHVQFTLTHAVWRQGDCKARETNCMCPCRRANLPHARRLRGWGGARGCALPDLSAATAIVCSPVLPGLLIMTPAVLSAYSTPLRTNRLRARLPDPQIVVSLIVTGDRLDSYTSISIDCHCAISLFATHRHLYRRWLNTISPQTRVSMMIHSLDEMRLRDTVLYLMNYAVLCICQI